MGQRRNGSGSADGRASPVAPPGAVPAVGYACLAGAILAYGTLWTLMRVGVQTMPPLWFAAVRMGAACVFLFAVLAALRRLRLPRRQDMPVILSVGIGMMGLYACLSQVGLLVVGAGRATLLGYTTPIWVTPIAVIFLRERVGPLKLLGLAVALAGLAVLFNPLSFDWSRRDVVVGNGLLVVAAIVWAGSIVQMRTQVYRLEPIQLMPWQLLTSTVVCLAAALALEPGLYVAPTPANLALIGFSGPAITTLSIWLGTMTVRHLPAVTASVGFLGVPVTSTMIAWAILGEALSPTLAGGLAVIIAGLALASYAEMRER